MLLIAAWAAAMYAGEFDGWEIRNLGDGQGVITEFSAVDGKDKVPVLFSPNNKSWLFYIKNLLPAELKDAKKLYLSADIISNNPELVRIVIGENDEWGNAMRRMQAVNAQNMPYQWQHIEVELDRIFDESFFSCGIGMEYKAAGTWMAAANVQVSTEPHDAKALPELNLSVPDKFNNFSMESVMTAGKIMNALALSSPNMAKKPEFKTAQNWLTTVTGMNNTNDLGHFFTVTNDFLPKGISVTAVPSATEYDYSTIMAADNSTYTVTMPNQATDGFLYLIRNNTSRPENITVRFNGKAAESGKMFQLLEVDETPDYPLELKNNDFIHLGANETVGVLMQFNTSVPGEFAGELELEPFNPKLPVQEMPFILDVVNVDLPKNMPIKIFHWDYMGANDPVKLKLLADGRVNTFHLGDLNVINKPEIDWDFDKYRQAIRKVKQAVPDIEPCFLLEVWFVNVNKGWKKEYEPWLDKLVAMFEEEGVDYKHWYLEIYDETLSEEFYQSAKAIKEYNPKVQIFSDCLNKEPGIVAKFAPYLDVWCPAGWIFPPYTYQFEEELKQVKELPSEYWIYSCGPVPCNPARTFRQQPLLSFVWDMQNCSYWTTYYINTRGALNPNDHFGFFYNNPNGVPVQSRRWLEWQGGLNDYLILDMAEQNPATAELVKELRPYIYKNLTQPDFWVDYSAKRTELLKKMAK